MSAPPWVTPPARPGAPALPPSIPRFRLAPLLFHRTAKAHLGHQLAEDRPQRFGPEALPVAIQRPLAASRPAEIREMLDSCTQLNETVERLNKPGLLALVRWAARFGRQMDLRSGIDLETFIVFTVYGTGDENEGIFASLEKREA